MNIKKWINALREGLYPRGRGMLNRNGLFCALGVGVDIYIREHGERWALGGYGAMAHENLRAGMSPRVLEWYGIDEKTEYRVAEMNDRGDSWEDIASYLEGL